MASIIFGTGKVLEYENQFEGVPLVKLGKHLGTERNDDTFLKIEREHLPSLELC